MIACIIIGIVYCICEYNINMLVGINHFESGLSDEETLRRLLRPSSSDSWSLVEFLEEESSFASLVCIFGFLFFITTPFSMTFPDFFAGTFDGVRLGFGSGVVLGGLVEG